ncbi:MAG TPA: tetratricopeptide repeat protein [Aggregatilineales bacterium]|nr:tetratricopeptide repeat protein [Aggregatilineales bacterium]
MATTNLRAYLGELNSLLEQEALEEVIGHCRHILQHFPKNVETYRILGQALLARGRNDEAVEVFQRVLGAIPDDLIGTFGMSRANEHRDPNAALWYMARTLDQEPHNDTFREELRALLASRDGDLPESIPLTRGALARLYLRGGMYTNAIAELISAYNESPQRADLGVLLAQAQWVSGDMVGAGETALRLLETNPDCLEGNKIFAAYWIRLGRPSDAAPFVSRLELLDPFAAWEAVHGEGASPPENAFSLPRLVWDARAAAQMATDVPDWVSSIGEVFEAPELFSPSTGIGGNTPFNTDASGTFTMPVGTKDPLGTGSLRKRTGITDMFNTPTEEAASGEAPDWFKDIAEDTGMGTPPLPLSGGATWLDEDDDLPNLSFDAAPSTADLGGAAWLADDDNGFPNLTLDAAPSTADLGGAAWLADDDASEDVPAVDPLAWLQTGQLTDPDATSTSLTAAEEDEPALDSLAWLQTGQLTDPDATSAPLTAAEEDEPALDSLAWLQTGQLIDPDTLPRSAQPIAAEEPDGLDVGWLLGEQPSPSAELFPNAADALATFDVQSAESALDAPMTFEREGDMPEDELALDFSFQSLELPAMPAPSAPELSGEFDFNADLAPDWLSSETPSNDFTELGTALDTLSLSETLSDKGETAPAAEGDLAFDWLSGGLDLPDTPTSALSSAESTEDDTLLTADALARDWLGDDATSLSTSVVLPAATAPDDLDWLAADLPPLPTTPPMLERSPELNFEAESLLEVGSERLDIDLSILEGFAPDIAPPDAAPDPMAWFQQFQATGEVPSAPLLGEEGDEAAAESAPAAALGVDFDSPEEALNFLLSDSPAEESSEERREASEADVLAWLQTENTAPSGDPLAALTLEREFGITTPPPAEAPPSAGLDWLNTTPAAQPQADWLQSMPAAAPAASTSTDLDEFAILFEANLPAFSPPDDAQSAAITPPMEIDWLAKAQGGEGGQPTPVLGTPLNETPADFGDSLDLGGGLTITPPETPAEPTRDDSELPLYKRKVTAALPTMITTPLSPPQESNEASPSWLTGDLFGEPAAATDTDGEDWRAGAEAQFENLIQATSERVNQPLDTGELIASDAALLSGDQPSWLTDFGEAVQDTLDTAPSPASIAMESVAESSFDLGSLFGEGGFTGTTSDSADASQPVDLSEALDAYRTQDAETEIAPAEGMPDWLQQARIGGEPDFLPGAAGDSLSGLEALDFGSLETFEASADPFAAPTGAETNQPPPANEGGTEGDGSDFTFTKLPAWKRKKK